MDSDIKSPWLANKKKVRHSVWVSGELQIMFHICFLHYWEYTYTKNYLLFIWNSELSSALYFLRQPYSERELEEYPCSILPWFSLMQSRKQHYGVGHQSAVLQVHPGVAKACEPLGRHRVRITTMLGARDPERSKTALDVRIHSWWRKDQVRWHDSHYVNNSGDY